MRLVFARCSLGGGSLNTARSIGFFNGNDSSSRTALREVERCSVAIKKNEAYKKQEEMLLFYKLYGNSTDMKWQSIENSRLYKVIGFCSGSNREVMQSIQSNSNIMASISDFGFD